jgi:GxxExxY protein
MSNESLFSEEFYKIKKACLNIKEKLGIGFLEDVYEKALIVELTNAGFKIEEQKYFDVIYDGKNIGNYIADLVLNDSIIIELKTVDQIIGIHKAQIINYLKISKYPLGLIINFSAKLNSFEIERIPNYVSYPQE